MRRLPQQARPDWQKIVESQGLLWHTTSGEPYWDESACYAFSIAEIETLERATNELHALCLEAVQHVIDHRLYAALGIPEAAIPLIERSWEQEDPSIYGRFDLAYDGAHPPKLLEYNADTPTSLLEAAVVQWFWLEQVHAGADQFNSIHERLIATWQDVRPYLHEGGLTLTHADEHEDEMTCAYLAETAQQGGIAPVRHLRVDELGWNALRRRFVDLEERPIRNLFKLYPWEWLTIEPFGQHIPSQAGAMFWIEPPWKMVLSNKAILPILWQLHPNHPNLLEAHPAPADPEALFGGRGWVRKPCLSREGQNVELHPAGGAVSRTQGTYGDGPAVVQELAPLPCFDGRTPVLGSWVIGGEAAGMGIRESAGPVTDNTSRFIPHVIL